MKELILLRHGAAVWAENGREDRHRSLTDVGRAESIRQAQWLMDNGHVPAHVLISGARRARETWDNMRNNLIPHPGCDIIEELYLAEPGTLLSYIETLPDTAQTALIVGHNPGIEALASMLAGSAPDIAAMRDMARGFPPAGMGLFDVTTDRWEQITVAESRLAHFARPN